MERRCRRWQVGIRRRRKRLPRGPLSAEEVVTLQALGQIVMGVNALLARMAGPGIEKVEPADR